MAAITKATSQMADRDGNPLIGPAQANVADAVVAHALNATFDDTEVEGALDAQGVKINAIFNILEAHGLAKAS